MLIPDNCAVVLVDAAASSSSKTTLEMIVNRVQRLMEVAYIIHVPIVLAHYPTSAAHGILSARITLPAPPQSFPLHPKPEAWASTDLGNAIAATCRNQVVIAGFWLEEAVTLLTLNVDCNRVLIFAGRRTVGQSRLNLADKANPLNYLENPNASSFSVPTASFTIFAGAAVFDWRNPSADVVRCLA